MSDIKTEKQKVQEITEKLEQGIKELFQNEEYKISSDAIKDAAAKLIANIEGRLQELQTDRATEQEQDIVLLLSNADYSRYSLLNVRGMERAELYNRLSGMNDDDRSDIEAYLERKGAWVTPLADEKTEEVKEYHIDYVYNTDTYEITDRKAMEEMEKKSLEPIKDTDVVIKISSEQGENCEIDKITNMPQEEVRELLNEIAALDENMWNGNVQKYLEEKGAELTPIISSGGLNKGGVQFYDFQLDMDKGEVTDSTVLSPIKQAENLINRMEHGITRFTGEERDLIVDYNYKFDDMGKTKALAEGIAYQAEGKEHIIADAQAEIDRAFDGLTGVIKEQGIPEESREETPHTIDKVSYYVIEDLSTWAEGGAEKSQLEQFDSLPEAMEKFSEYQKKDAGDKEDAARATFGFRVNGMEFDVIHVRNKEKHLSLDFTHSKAAQESRQFMEDLQVLSDKIGFDKVRVHREMTPEEVKDFVKQRFEYRLKQGGIEDISFYMSRFDNVYEQGKMEHLMPATNQKHIVEDIPFTEWENPYIDVNVNPGNEEIDEGETAATVKEKPNKVQKSVAEEQEENKKTVTLTVAECGEFHNLGEYHENVTSVEEALRIFNEIPPERMNGIPSIGIKMHTEGTEDYEDIQMDIFSAGIIDLEALDYVPDITDNPKAMEMVAQLIEKIPDAEVMGSLEKWQPQEELPAEEEKEADEAAKLAAEIDRFSYEYDTAQYNEVVEDRQAQVENIAADIRIGNTEYLKDFLNAAISEEVRLGITDIFGQGVEIGDSEAVRNARKAKGLSDRLAEYKPLAKIEELEEANYNMIDNVLNNEKPKREEERPQGRISVKEKLAEKRAVIQQRDRGDKPLMEKDTEKKPQREM